MRGMNIFEILARAVDLKLTEGRKGSCGGIKDQGARAFRRSGKGARVAEVGARDFRLCTTELVHAESASCGGAELDAWQSITVPGGALLVDETSRVVELLNIWAEKGD